MGRRRVYPQCPCCRQSLRTVGNRVGSEWLASARSERLRAIERHPCWVTYGSDGLFVLTTPASPLIEAITDRVLATGKSHWEIVTEILEDAFQRRYSKMPSKSELMDWIRENLWRAETIADRTRWSELLELVRKHG